MSPTLAELTNVPDPAWPLMARELQAAPHSVDVLPVARAQGEKILQALQISAHSFLGALALNTAGVLLDHGWLRLLAAGHHPRMQRSLPGWNVTLIGQATGLMLVADDVLGGFFAVDGGALDLGKGAIYRLGPDRLEWESFAPNFTAFFRWAVSAELGEYYARYRWTGWESQVEPLTGDQGLAVQPYLFTQEGRDVAAVEKSVATIDALFENYAITLPTSLGLIVPDCLK